MSISFNVNPNETRIENLMRLARECNSWIYKITYEIFKPTHGFSYGLWERSPEHDEDEGECDDFRSAYCVYRAVDEILCRGQGECSEETSKKISEEIEKIPIEYVTSPKSVPTELQIPEEELSEEEKIFADQFLASVANRRKAVQAVLPDGYYYLHCHKEVVDEGASYDRRGTRPETPYDAFYMADKATNMETYWSYAAVHYATITLTDFKYEYRLMQVLKSFVTHYPCFPFDLNDMYQTIWYTIR